MKTRSVFFGFLEGTPGRHRAFNEWHDADHRPENHGTIDHVFHSARWVALPEHVAAQEAQPGGLVGVLGQYVATYWSTASPERLLYDMTVVRERLRLLGRCGPINRDFHSTWRDRMHPIKAYVGPSCPLAPDAVPLAVHQGIVAGLTEYPEDKDSWARWYDESFAPRLLGPGDVAGLFTLMPMREVDHHLFVSLAFVTGDALEVQARAREIERDQVGGEAVIHGRGAYVPATADRYGIHD